mgnify:CR=1 FL=1
MHRVWLKPRDAAAYIGVHVNTLRAFPPERLPYMVVSARGDRRYLLADLSEYVGSRTVRTAERAQVVGVVLANGRASARLRVAEKVEA